MLLVNTAHPSYPINPRQNSVWCEQQATKVCGHLYNMIRGGFECLFVNIFHFNNLFRVPILYWRNNKHVSMVFVSMSSNGKNLL